MPKNKTNVEPEPEKDAVLKSSSLAPPGKKTKPSKTKTLAQSIYEGDEDEPPPRQRYPQGSGGSSTLIGASPGVLDYAGGEEPDEDEVGGLNQLRNQSSSVIEFYPTWCRCLQCIQRDTYEPGPDSCKTMFLCPPQGLLVRIIVFLLICFLTWAFSWVLLEHTFGNETQKSPAAPGGPISALTILEVVGLFAGISMKLIGLPSLLGPLVLGILLKNIPHLDIFLWFRAYEYRDCHFTNSTCIQEATETAGHWISPIRRIALTMILTRAGLELSPKQLKKMRLTVPALAFGPCIIETITAALLTYLLFHVAGDSSNKPLISFWMCLVAGSALAAVSPAVVVPGMLSLKRKKYGVSQGVPTLLIAASSIDDVLAISLYTIFLGIALSESTEATTEGQAEWVTYVSGPLGLVVGVFHGFIVGIFLHFIPSRDTRNKGRMRLVLLLLFNVLSMFLYEKFELVAGAGSLSVLVTSFISSFGWRSQAHWKHPMKRIEHSLSLLWTLCVPLLFGTIGREMNFHDTETFTLLRLGKILLIIVISLMVRCIAAGLLSGLAGLDWKERLFCGLAWMPKATVQATLAPIVITKIQEHKATDLKAHGQIVVTLAVLGILISAPLGAVLIKIFGPRLLKKATIIEQEELEQEFPHGEGVDPTDSEIGVIVEYEMRQQKSKLDIIGRSSFSTTVVELRNKDNGSDEEGPRRTKSEDVVPKTKSKTTLLTEHRSMESQMK